MMQIMNLQSVIREFIYVYTYTQDFDKKMFNIFYTSILYK